MGVRSNNKDVDFSKLNAELNKRGWSVRSASIQMGRSAGYLTCMKAKGYLPESTFVMLDSIWNIKYEDIAPTESEEPMVAPTENMPLTVEGEELRYIITEAVKDAFMWYANR